MSGSSARILLLALCVLGFASHAFSSDGSTTVPIQLRGKLPLFVAKINGMDVPLTLDLGDSSALALSPKLIARIKITPINETERSSDVKGNVIEATKFKVPLLQIGTVSFNDVTGKADLHDPSYEAADTGQKGRVGTELFSGYKVLIDYPHRKMTLIPKDAANTLKNDCTGTVVPFLPEWNGDPVTKVTIDERELIAVWDTGSPFSILRKSGAQDIGDSVLKKTITAKHFQLGSTDFGPFKLYEADYAEPAGTDMFIGYNFFAKHVVCVDFPRNRFLIRRQTVPRKDDRR